MSKSSSSSPRVACQYNDIIIHCPHCHNQIIIFSGFHEKQTCYKCGKNFKDAEYRNACKRHKKEKEELY